MESVPLDSEHEEKIESMNDPVVLEMSEIVEIELKLGKLEILREVAEQRDRILDKAS